MPRLLAKAHLSPGDLQDEDGGMACIEPRETRLGCGARTPETEQGAIWPSAMARGSGPLSVARGSLGGDGTSAAGSGCAGRTTLCKALKIFPIPQAAAPLHYKEASRGEEGASPRSARLL
jgi:hypothetical protein